MTNLKNIKGTSFDYYENLDGRLLDLDRHIQEMQKAGKLSPQALKRIQKYFRIKDIYHSNAIEGNALTIGETRLVVEMGMTLAGKTLRDQAEAENLSHALDFMEDIASSTERPITVSDLRQIHALILKGIQDEYAGKYRRNEVKISGSEYKPPEAHLISQNMDELGAYVRKVTSPDSPDADLPILCAAAAHAWLAQIHPFIDGNGRTARILMNLILMRRGYPICIITRDDRLRYYDALEDSQAGDLTPLIELVYENVEESLEEWEKAAQEQEWLEDITARLEEPALNQARNEYEVWLRAMELFKSYFKKIVDDVNEMKTVGSGWLNFKDYGTLSFEKYLSLRDGRSAKKTWFFGIEFGQGGKRARYLFFFGYPDDRLRPRTRVVLIIAKDIDYSKDIDYYGYVPLMDINTLDMYQVGFDMANQTFVASTVSSVQEGKVEDFAKQLFEGGSEMFQIRENYYKTSIKLVRKSQRDMKPTVTKTAKAQEVYLRNNSNIYTEDEIEKIRYFLDAFLYKFQLANYNLEQLWTIRDAKVEQNLFDIARNSIDSLELTNDEVFLQSHVLEQFLFQGRSCLDFFMLYLAHFLGTNFEGYMSKDKFYKKLKKLKNAPSPSVLNDKATCIEDYFQTKIFSSENKVDILLPTNWGTLLSSLRNKIAHRDIIKISKNSDDRIMNDILLDFPTLKDLTYDRFCQAMHNGMWYMITDLFPILYDLEWQAGPYREGMFESESDSAGKSG